MRDAQIMKHLPTHLNYNKIYLFKKVKNKNPNKQVR